MKRECPEPERPGCPYSPYCYSDQHHLYFPARDYRTPLEKRFRELPDNKEQLCRFLHDLAHFEEAPEKPTREEMHRFIAGMAIEETGNDAA